MNVSITPALERFVSKQLNSGRYQTASEVFRDGLRLLQEREAERKAALTEVRRKVADGLDAAKRGELLDGEAVFDEILTRRGTRGHKPSDEPTDARPASQNAQPTPIGHARKANAKRRSVAKR